MPKTKRRPALRKMTVADAISEAFNELQSLGEEMRSWADNIEEKFSQTDRYQRISDAADTLESLEEPPFDGDGIAAKYVARIIRALPEVEIYKLIGRSKRRGPSRADRCSHACGTIEQCMSIIEENINDLGDDNDHKYALESLRDDLKRLKDDAEGVEFPGMFG